jgi:uncharacterized protein (UPF0332 family)
MLSREKEKQIGQHLRLARGLLETAVVELGSSEFEERNALSRAYYAIFHASKASLLYRSAVDRRMKHGQLQEEMRRGFGESLGSFIGELYRLRRSADYSQDWVPVRFVSEAKLKLARTNVLYLCGETERGLRRESSS